MTATREEGVAQLVFGWSRIYEDGIMYVQHYSYYANVITCVLVDEHTGRSPMLITFKGCMKGLGVSIAGGREAHCGIFIKAVLANSLAARDGRSNSI